MTRVLFSPPALHRIHPHRAPCADLPLATAFSVRWGGFLSIGAHKRQMGMALLRCLRGRHSFLSTSGLGLIIFHTSPSLTTHPRLCLGRRAAADRVLCLRRLQDVWELGLLQPATAARRYNYLHQVLILILPVTISMQQLRSRGWAAELGLRWAHAAPPPIQRQKAGPLQACLYIVLATLPAVLSVARQQFGIGAAPARASGSRPVCD